MTNVDWDALEAEFNQSETPDVVDVTTLGMEELVTLYNDTGLKLIKMSEALVQRTEEARDLASLRYACRLELLRRSQGA